MKQKHYNSTKIGLDVGAIVIKAVFAGRPSGDRIVYRLHRGEPEETIAAIVREVDITPDAIAVTGAGGKRVAEKLRLTYVDPAVALIAAVQGDCFVAGAPRHDTVRHIVDIGGGSLSIVDLDASGRFAGFRTNSLCAAGTGSFLDEQAIRMNLSDEEKAREHTIAEPPRIAARCAVFAKSDLIHRQQEGYSIPEMWSGLCRGMVHTALTTLFRGRKPQGPVLLVGGVAQNREVVRWLRTELEAELVIPDDPATFSARGALLSAAPAPGPIAWEALLAADAGKTIPRRPRLELILSTYPSFDCRKGFVDDETEVRIHSDLCGPVVIGIDIGSTSTKAAILDMEGRAVADLYRRTAGDPIGATQRLFAAIGRAAAGPLVIRGIGTTGSGRKMVGAIVGADRIVNEITAHARGAAVADPDVETIFEIGGQDAKFVSLKEGVPHDSNMNYVCAAGTGSFVEEQAGKLGFALTEIGDAVMGTEPPFSTDRCTVFMEQDVYALIHAGFDRREVMGSVLFSVVQNYLNKVVGRRPYSRKKICFMGATARNKGLVAAFERLLEAPISVSPYCHVMGAMGVATIVLEEVARPGAPTAFRGLKFAEETVELVREACELCSNSCRITRAIIGPLSPEGRGENAVPSPLGGEPCLPAGRGQGEGDRHSPSWGYLCGRDPEGQRIRVTPHFDAFRKRDRLWKQSIPKQKATPHPPLSPEGRGSVNSFPSPLRGEGQGEGRCVGIPRALLAFSQLPLWAKFFGALGTRIVLSAPTGEDTLASAIDFIGSDYCYPVKLAHGHVRELAGHPEVDAVFLPYIVQGQPHDDAFKRSVFCPYNIAFPSIIRSSGVADDTPILTAVINFQLALGLVVDELVRELGATLKANRRQIERAWLAALRAQASFETNCEAIGRDALAALERENGRGVVILGRPYNVCDLGANLSLPRKIADLDLTVFTVDMLPLKDVPIDPLFHNMYWRYGRKILQAATLVANHPRLFAVFLTNFGCGPDSFLQTYVERIMRGKPMLMLELDEHSADAGYITRLEAFKDVIDRPGASASHGSPDSFERREEAPLSAAVKDAVLPTAGPEPASEARGRSEKGSGEPMRTHSNHGSVAPVRTLWIPPMHPYGTPLLAAALRSVGKPAQPLPTETAETFDLAKRFCRGTECVPLPSTIGAFLNVLKKSDAPERECLFMPSAKGPCRFGQYHTLHRIILNEAGFPATPIEAWSDESGNYGMGPKTSRRLFNAMLAADLLYKARCRIRPYADDRDAFDALMAALLQRLVEAAEANLPLSRTLRGTAERLAAVRRTDIKKPLVGIVGEIYVRLNPFTNGRLVETIEDEGGEAWVAPITEWIQYLSFLDRQRGRLERHPFGQRFAQNLKNAYMMRQERRLFQAMAGVVGDRAEPSMESTLAAGGRCFPLQFDGESILTVGRAIEFAHQGADLVINCAPFGCMPGTMTSGIFQRLEREMGIPVVSLFFDGETDLRHLVRTYLVNIGRGIAPLTNGGRQTVSSRVASRGNRETIFR